MKRYTKILHFITRSFMLEGLCLKIGRFIPMFNKLVPLPHEYAPGKFINVKRDRVTYTIDRSDYMQWSIYANLKDNSWQTAIPYGKSNACILDIGANCGQFSLKLAAALEGKKTSHFEVHSFEPNAKIFTLLASNLNINSRLKPYVKCHKIALGDENSIKLFTHNKINSGGGSVIAERGQSEQVEEVTMTKLDDWVISNAIANIVFIKIDVEGYEPEVILGGENTITSMKPVLYIEMTEAWFNQRNHSVSSIISKLTQWNYELWGELDGKIVSYFEYRQQFNAMHQFNLLAKPIAN